MMGSSYGMGSSYSTNNYQQHGYGVHQAPLSSMAYRTMPRVQQPSSFRALTPIQPVQRAVAIQAPVRVMPPPPMVVKARPKSVQKVGLGLLLEKNDHGDVVVTYVVPGFAAATSGQIRAFDVVLSIDGVPVKDLDLKDIKAMTIGNEGSTCNMEIRHDTGRHMAKLRRRIPEKVDWSNEECTHSVMKFEAADHDSNGYITLDEMRRSLPKSWTEDQVQRFFRNMDTDGDNMISRQEYDNYFHDHRM